MLSWKEDGPEAEDSETLPASEDELCVMLFFDVFAFCRYDTMKCE